MLARGGGAGETRQQRAPPPTAESSQGPGNVTAARPRSLPVPGERATRNQPCSLATHSWQRLGVSSQRAGSPAQEPALRTEGEILWFRKDILQGTLVLPPARLAAGLMDTREANGAPGRWSFRTGRAAPDRTPAQLLPGCPPRAPTAGPFTCAAGVEARVRRVASSLWFI